MTTTLADYSTIYGPWVLVTGGSQGMGLAIASELAQRNFNVVITGRRMEPLETAARQLRDNHGADIRLIAADAASAADYSSIPPSRSRSRISRSNAPRPHC